MKKKILAIFVSLLVLAMLATPVMAVSPKKIALTIERSGFWYTPTPDFWITGNVRHSRGASRGFSNWVITGAGMPTLTGSSSAVGNYNINLENGHGAVQLKVTLTFSSGTFEGTTNLRGTLAIAPNGFPMPIDAIGHARLQGTDDYKGWTLVWTRVGGVFTEAYMLIP